MVLFSFSDDAFATYRDGKLADSKEQNSHKVKQQVNKYANYIHFQPEWNSYPSNLIFEISTSWQREIDSTTQEESGLYSQGAKNRKNTLQYVNGKPFIEVQYDYIDCKYQWIHYSKIGLDFLENQFGFLLGYHKQSEQNSSYPNNLQQTKLKDGFAQFIPICTSKDTTSYDYTVSINDDDLGVDVYFVPAYREKWDYFYEKSYFDYYSSPGCFGQNYQSFSGTCKGVDANAGLLIVIPDELSKPLTKISIKLEEHTS